MSQLHQAHCLRQCSRHCRDRDKTTARQELWDKCGEDTLRGLFLQQLRSTCGADPQSQRLMEQAAAFGLAAIDDREV